MANLDENSEPFAGLSELEWSSTSFTVDEFLKKFSLPQIVKVNEGYYGDDEASSLGADQVLTLHLVKSTEKIFGHEYRGKEVHVPINCPNKVEVRPSNSKDVYETVDELLTAMPSFVRISQGCYSIARDEEILNVGDKLQLKSVERNKKGKPERLICVNQNGTTIELPHDCSAGFQPLVDGKEYYIAEVMKHFTLPLYIQFVDPPVVGSAATRQTNEGVFNSSLGTIYLQKKYQENLVIASTISSNGKRTVVTFPRDMDIRVSASENMLHNSMDYSRVCKMIHDDVDLVSFRHIDAYAAFRPRHSIKEFSYTELVSRDDVNSPSTPPEVKRSISLKAKESIPPEVEESTPPEVKKSTPPEVKSTLPEVKKSTPPEVKKSTLPEVKKSTPPEVKKSIPPEVKRSVPVMKHLSPEIKRKPEVKRSSPEAKRSSPDVAVDDKIPADALASDKQDEKSIEPDQNGAKNIKPGKPSCPPKPLRKQGSLMNEVEATKATNTAELEDSPSATNNVSTNQTTVGLQPQNEALAADENHHGDTNSKAVPLKEPLRSTQSKTAPDISACSVKQVSNILRDLGMLKYVVKFESEMIDGEMLSCLTDDILMSEFGMNKLHCMKLKKYLEGWRPKL